MSGDQSLLGCRCGLGVAITACRRTVGRASLRRRCGVERVRHRRPETSSVEAAVQHRIGHLIRALETCPVPRGARPRAAAREIFTACGVPLFDRIEVPHRRRLLTLADGHVDREPCNRCPRPWRRSRRSLRAAGCSIRLAGSRSAIVWTRTGRRLRLASACLRR